MCAGFSGEVQELPIFRQVAGRVGNRILDITVKWQDAVSGRARVRAPDGTDLIIHLPGGLMIRDGEVFGPSPDGIYYRVLIEPGKVETFL